MKSYFDGDHGRRTDWTPAERTKMRKKAKEMEQLFQQKLGELPPLGDGIKKMNLINPDNGKGFLA